MAKIITPLTDRQVKALTYSDTGKNRLFDGKGLYVEVRKTGVKTFLFQQKLRTSGKTYRKTLGQYPEITLADARDERERLRTIIKQGKDPRIEEKKILITETSFEHIAERWLNEAHSKRVQPKTLNAIKRLLETYVYPELGQLPLPEIESPDIVKALQQIECKSSHIAQRCHNHMKKVWNYGVQLGIIKLNLASALTDIVTPPQHNNYPALSKNDFPRFLYDLDSFRHRTTISTFMALQISMLLFQRKSEIIDAEWDEIDLENGVWVIPWQRMKSGRRLLNPKRKDHIIDLPRQAVRLLSELKEITCSRKFVFPSHSNIGRPISHSTMNTALKHMGYGGRMTVHGFRAMATSILDNSGKFIKDGIERHLAHNEKNMMLSAYHRDDYREERQRLLQYWADYIDEIREKNKTTFGQQS